MRNYRFFLSHIQEPVFQITDKNILHKMNKVLRLNKDSQEELEFFDSSSFVYKAKINELTSSKAVLTVIEKSKSKRELDFFVKFYIPIIKPENYFWMLRKLTELGVAEFQPVHFERSQKKYLETIQKQKEKALITIQEAVEQCSGAVLPRYNEIKTFSELQFSTEIPNKYFAYEELSLKKSSLDIPKMTDTLIMVGPEGGLTSKEVKDLGEMHFTAVGLGSRLLKAETAAIVLFSRIYS